MMKINREEFYAVEKELPRKKYSQVFQLQKPWKRCFLYIPNFIPLKKAVENMSVWNKLWQGEALSKVLLEVLAKKKNTVLKKSAYITVVFVGNVFGI